MDQWVTNSGRCSNKLSTGIFLMEWCSVWNIQQSALFYIDYLFEMPHHRCAWGTCNSDSRYKDRNYVNGVIFLCFQNHSQKMICTLLQLNVLDGLNYVAVPLTSWTLNVYMRILWRKKDITESKVNSLYFPSFNPLGQLVLVDWQFECKFNSLRPSDSIWRHELRQHWLM